MKYIIGSLVSLAIIGGLAAAVILKPVSNTQSSLSQQKQPTDSTTPSPTASPNASESSGRYIDYTISAAKDSSYDETILFFHAPWCSECRAFEQSIQGSTVPDNVQILKVDYDSSSDLRSQYDVTVQTTFVKIDTSGSKVSSWVGYGKDKSVNAILKNT